jgi:energy-converting hydrogenase Eha subunit A
MRCTFPLFQIGGIALMAVGGIALKKIGDVKHVFEDGDHPGIFPAFVIAIGALVFVIAFFGKHKEPYNFLDSEF